MGSEANIKKLILLNFLLFAFYFCSKA